MTTRQQYAEFLRSSTWKIVRAKAMNNAGRKCAACGCCHSLEAHHVLYRKGWHNTKPDDLLILCDRCHTNAHTSIHKVAFIKNEEERDLFKIELREHLKSVFVAVRSGYGAAAMAKAEYDRRCQQARERREAPSPAIAEARAERALMQKIQAQIKANKRRNEIRATKGKPPKSLEAMGYLEAAKYLALAKPITDTTS